MKPIHEEYCFTGSAYFDRLDGAQIITARALRFALTMSTIERARILLFGPQLSAVGGGPTHTRNMLASSLSDHYELVHFEIGSRGRESPASEEKLVIRMSRLLSSPFLLIWRIIQQRPLLLHLNTSLNHKSFWRDFGYLIIGKLLRRKVILQIHGGSLERFCQSSSILRHVSLFAYRIADAVVVLSTVEKRNFEKISGVKELVVIPNAIDLAEYHTESPRKHSGNVRQLVYLGRITREKGLFEAVTAIKLLVSDLGVNDIQFVIAGSGSARADLLSQIEVMELGKHVRIIEPLYGKEKVRFLQQADVFLFPSYHEGLPYSILESLAAGTPVIASNVGGIPDAVIDGIHGLLIEPRDPRQIVEAIRKLVSNDDLVRTMSQNCLSWARQNYGLQRLSNQFDELYRSLVGDKRQ